ncbi:MAG TPA: tyrosine-protein phosphatase [Baekduia sp.]|nr:tyrosine-protein phosphatase [Baekduia sp.]
MASTQDLTTSRWIDLDGAVNARETGGLPLASGGRTASGVLLRSDNLQDLSARDVRRLLDEHGVRAVVDLRTGIELDLEGPGPLHDVPEVRIEHRSLYPETGGNTDLDADGSMWVVTGRPAEPGESPAVHAYRGYLEHRPDSIVAALRTVAQAEGAVLVHCAAGKDRTGVVVALALAAAGVRRDAIVEDYLATASRIDAIVSRLAARPTYAAEIRVDDPQSHAPRPGTMERVFEVLDQEHGGPVAWLQSHGFGDEDLAALRARLRG